MSKSMIYTVNDTAQEVADGGTINLGSVIRRFGCNLGLSGNAVLVDGTGYYDFDASVTLTPSAAGTATVTLKKDGIEVPGATATVELTGTTTTALPIAGVVRENCCCDGASNLTLVLSGVAATVNNVATKTVKL